MAVTEPIVFLGSGPVAAESLRQLHDAHFTIEAVITKPQPPHHKQPFPVLKLAEELGLPTYTPASKKEITGFVTSHEFESRAGIVIDYGFILEQAVLDAFPLGILNSHFSLLPKLRGADPITFAILDGQSTGVSLMRIVAKMDEGPILGQSQSIDVMNETNETLTSKLIADSTALISELLPSYLAGETEPSLQDPSIEATYTRKLSKADGELDFTKSARLLEREVRAYLGWPGSYTTLSEKPVIITKAHTEKPDGSYEIGDISVKSKTLRIQTADDLFVIDQLKPAGKKEMPVSAFLLGYKLD